MPDVSGFYLISLFMNFRAVSGKRATWWGRGGRLPRAGAGRRDPRAIGVGFKFLL